MQIFKATEAKKSDVKFGEESTKKHRFAWKRKVYEKNKTHENETKFMSINKMYL